MVDRMDLQKDLLMDKLWERLLVLMMVSDLVLLKVIEMVLTMD